MDEKELNPAQETPAAETPEQTPAEPAPKAKLDKRSPLEIAIAVVAVVLIIAALVAVVVGGVGSDTEPTDPTGTVAGTVPADGNHDDVTCKGTYTVTDEQAAADSAKVIGTMAGQEMTNADLQIFYWMQVVSFLNEYGTYASAMGLDYTQPLDTQKAMVDEDWTWQQYFLDCALDAWMAYEALAQEAAASGFDKQSEDYQTYAASVRDEVQASAESYGFASIEEMLAANVGPGSTEDAYIDYMQTYYLGYLYFNELYNQLTPTDAEVAAYYDSHADEYAEAGYEKDDSIYVDVRHILIMPEGGTTDASGETVYSEEEWETARVEAQTILDEWLAGKATEETFADLANVNSDDSDGTDGGLYTDVPQGMMVSAFDAWCFDPARQQGDYGLVKTEFGYHVMYFSGSTPIWYATAESDLLAEISNSIVPEILEKYEGDFDYTSMVLAQVDLAE